MSEENLQKVPEGEAQEGDSAPESHGPETIELRINKARNELTLVDPSTGHSVAIKAIIIEEDEEEDNNREEVKRLRRPLTPDEFREVFIKLNELGITWSADVPPLPRFKEGVERSETFTDEYLQIQRNYNRFPRELGALIVNELMGKPQSPALVGGDEDVQKKLAILREALPVNGSYRSEFFFKHAIKVPYFEDADWEVVVKAYERGVKDMPKIAYALLSLAFRKPVDPTLPIEEGSEQFKYSRPDFITVAANEYLLDKLIVQLVEAREALDKAQQKADTLEALAAEEETEEEAEEKPNEHSKRNMG